MIDSLQDFKECIANTPLSDCECTSVPVLNTGMDAYVLNITAGNSDSLWAFARGLLPVSGRWPVVLSILENEGLEWEDMVPRSDLFSRFFYEEKDVSPSALIVGSSNMDFEDRIKTAYDIRGQYFELDEEIDFQLEDTVKRYGSSPPRAQLAASIKTKHPGYTIEAIDRYLFEWELNQDGSGNPEDARLDSYYDDPCVLVFLPTPHSYEALAYANWYGTIELGTEFHIAKQRQWMSQFGAELVANYGTIIEFAVLNPPTDIYTAWDLANEHDLLSPNTLGACGISIRHYAMGLMNCKRWSFHERP